jgi:hypothetical protein
MEDVIASDKTVITMAGDNYIYISNQGCNSFRIICASYKK